MTRSWIVGAMAAAAPLLLGLAVAAGDRERILRLAGWPAGGARPRAGWSSLVDARSTPAIVGAAASLMGAMLGGSVAAVLLGAGGAAAPFALRRRRRLRRIGAIREQLTDAVPALGSALRAGRSLPQGLEFAGAEVGPPLGPTLRDVADEVRLGEPLDAALADWEERVGGAEGRLVAGVLRLHLRTGGALAPALEDLSRTLRERLSAERELRGLTAQARLSAAILGSLPLGFLLFLSVVSRNDIEGALRTQLGVSAIVAGIVLQGLALLWIRRLMVVEPR